MDVNKQHAVTQSQLERFSQALDIIKSSYSTTWATEPLLRTCVIEAMESLIEDLAEQFDQLGQELRSNDEQHNS